MDINRGGYLFVVGILATLLFANTVYVGAATINPYVELSVNGVHPNISVERGSLVTLKWKSTQGTSNCALSGTFAWDTSGRVVVDDPYYNNLPPSGEVQLYANGAFLKNLDALDYTIQCDYPSSPDELIELQDYVSISLYGEGTGFLFTQILLPQVVHPDVKNLQKFLNINGFLLDTNGPGSPGNETEFFGPKTQNALVKFQDAHAKKILEPIGLSKGTGILGIMTIGFINQMTIEDL